MDAELLVVLGVWVLALVFGVALAWWGAFLWASEKPAFRALALPILIVGWAIIIPSALGVVVLAVGGTLKALGYT